MRGGRGARILQVLYDGLRGVGPLVRFVRHVRALATSTGRGRLRALRGGSQVLQPATVTRMNRRPVLFSFVASRLSERPAPRILSFGCATGEEALTLAQYVPGAAVDGIDANPGCIAQARRRAAQADMRGHDVRFVCADTPDAVAPDRYDAVVCLSVLRHGDLQTLRPERSTPFMTFAQFAAMVAALDRRVLPGGLLVLWGCHFRFSDTVVAAGYRMLPTPAPPHAGPFYGPDDRVLPDTETAAFVFVKDMAEAGRDRDG